MLHWFFCETLTLPKHDRFDTSHIHDHYNEAMKCCLDFSMVSFVLLTHITLILLLKHVYHKTEAGY